MESPRMRLDLNDAIQFKESRNILSCFMHASVTERSFIHKESFDSSTDLQKIFIIHVYFVGESLQLEGKLSASDRKREKAQAEIVAKQRRREEKAKRVRNKAKQIQDGDDVVDFAVDPDEAYNADEGIVL